MGTSGSSPPVRWDVLGLGNSCLDQYLVVDSIPAVGASVRLSDVFSAPGGQIAGALIGCARLGLKTTFALRTGDDEAGRAQWEALRREGVDVSLGAKVAGAPSASAYILLAAQGGERAVVWRTDDRLEVAPAELPAEAVEQARVLVLDGKDQAAGLRAARWMRALGRPVVSDIDAPRQGTRELIAEVTDCVCNQEFLAALHGPGALEAQLAATAALGPKVVVATLGARGAAAWEDGRVFTSPGFAISARDATGAGDAFRAGYTFALLRAWRLPERLVFANAAAALSCLGLGAQLALPTRAELLAFLARAGRRGPWQDLEAAS